jgi:hypothetical protein
MIADCPFAMSALLETIQLLFQSAPEPRLGL